MANAPMTASLLAPLGPLTGIHIVVAGDVMLDRYWHGSVDRVSQEAPVPIVGVTEIDDRPGGAANVALNAVALGARCTLVGAIGDDEAGHSLRQRLEAAGVACRFATCSATTIKLRIVGKGQQLLRADFDVRSESAASSIEQQVREALGDASMLLIEDYDKGAISNPEALIAAANCDVLVDPKRKPLRRYAGASVLKPNEAEFFAATGFAPSSDEGRAAAKALVAELDLRALVITRGSQGMLVVDRDGDLQRIPASSADVFDVTGAGDTAAAVLAVAIAAGRSPVDAARLANLASGLAVSRFGTVSVSGPELQQAVTHQPSGAVVSRPAARARIAEAQRLGQRVVFTNGCFDILHAGHVGYLEEARALGDLLVVAVNDDASVERLKGPGRPVNGLGHRSRVLAGLVSVDVVVAFSEDTPEVLLEELRPNLLVKGGDYTPEDVIGAGLVRSWGGEVQVLSLVDDCSTTAIVERLQGGEGNS